MRTHFVTLFMFMNCNNSFPLSEKQSVSNKVAALTSISIQTFNIPDGADFIVAGNMFWKTKNMT